MDDTSVHEFEILKAISQRQVLGLLTHLYNTDNFPQLSDQARYSSVLNGLTQALAAMIISFPNDETKKDALQQVIALLSTSVDESCFDSKFQVTHDEVGHA